METYRTCIGCCTDVMEELVVEALYTTPTQELAEAVSAMLNARGYKSTAQQLLDELYD